MKLLFPILGALALGAAALGLAAQMPSAGPPQSPRAAAPIDLSGYWVSVVTEDWRFRMLVPDKGDYASVPLNPAGRNVADGWDPASDEATGNACRSYGAAGIMRVPGRLHIYWENDDTLRIDTDSGTQERLLHFGKSPSPNAGQTWQGYSLAEWEGMRSRFLSPYMGEHARPGQQSEGYLKVATMHMRPGYLRKNGVPYSEKTVLKEYYDLFSEPNADTWFMVTTIVEDPTYLAVPFVTTSHFKKVADGSGWDPEPCTAR